MADDTTTTPEQTADDTTPTPATVPPARRRATATDTADHGRHTLRAAGNAARAAEAEQRVQALTERAVRAEVRAVAAADFADPADAVAFLDLSAYVDDDGEIDSDRIKADLADLLERKPHLAKAAAEPEKR